MYPYFNVSSETDHWTKASPKLENHPYYERNYKVLMMDKWRDLSFY